MLDLYNSDQLVVSSGSFSRPLRTTHDGKNGGADVKLFYVRNDDPTQWYQQVTILPTDSELYDDTIGEHGTGFSVKLKYGTVQPLPHEWESIVAGDSVDLPVDIGTALIADTTTYFPFWIRVNVPGATRVINKRDVKLELSCVIRPVTG
jgi:hypothetical protein